jgi:LCP family protein required for cell wall assembly
VDERERDEAGESDSTLPIDAVDPVPEAPPARPSRLRSLGTGVGRTFAALLSVGVIGTMGYGWWAIGDVDGATVTTDVIDSQVADNDQHGIPLDGAVDMLLVGMDSRTDAYGNPLPREVLDLLNAGRNEGERNTDTMILVHIPVDGTRAVAISFPRDAWVELAGGFGKHRLNSAFAYAWLDARGKLANSIKDTKELDAQATVIGRKNLIATIEQLIGKAVTIDRYAEVNLASFYEVTKAIGGVEVCLNEAVKDPRSGANFPQGRQTIEGAQALSFVRQRYGLPNGDFDRIVRQQVFLGALADKVLTADMLTSPTKVRELIAAVQRSVILSKGWDLSTFAAQMRDLSSGNIDFYTIPTLGGAKIGGADVIKVDPEAVHQFVAALTSDGSARSEEGSPDVGGSPSSVTTTTTSSRPTKTTTRPSETDAEPPVQAPANAITVDVRNASETEGLAASVQERLVQLGFRRGIVGDTPVQPVSVVRYASGEQYSAQLVANSLGGQLALEPDLSLPAGHVLVLVGTDFPTSQTQGFGRLAPTTSIPPTSTTTTPPQTPIVAGAHPCVN